MTSSQRTDSANFNGIKHQQQKRTFLLWQHQHDKVFTHPLKHVTNRHKTLFMIPKAGVNKVYKAVKLTTLSINVTDK